MFYVAILVSSLVVVMVDSAQQQIIHRVTGENVAMTCAATTSYATLFYPTWNKCEWSGITCLTNVLKTFPIETPGTGYETRVEYDAQSQTMTLKNLVLDDSAKYRCIAIAADLKYYHLYIAETPYISEVSRVYNKLIVNSTQDASVSCEASYVRESGSVTIEWLLDDELLLSDKVSLSSSTNRVSTTYRNTLTKRFAKEDNDKEIKCLLVRDGNTTWTEKSVTLDVIYPPESIAVKSYCKNRQWYIDGLNYSCPCNVGDANPSATSSWKIGNANWASTKLATFTASRNHNGKQFTCRADHVLLNGTTVTDDFTINVAFGPTDVTISQITGQAGNKLTVICETDIASPRATITFSGLSNGVTAPALPRIRKKCNNGHIYRVSYTFTPQRSDDGKVVTCTAVNSLKKAPFTAIKTATLNISYSPEEIINKSCDRKVAATITDYAQLCLHIDANPKPIKFEWTKGTAPNLRDINPKNQARHDQYNSSLTFLNVTSDDFGEYTVIVSNGIGEDTQLVYELFLPGRPDAPKDVEVINITAISATVTWTSPFNGGYEQKFEVDLRQSEHLVWKTSGKHIKDPGLAKAVSQKLKHLKENSNYEVRVRSVNSIGTSVSSTITFTTIIIGYDSDNPVTLIVGISVPVASLVIISMIGVVILCIRRSGVKGSNENYEHNNRNVDLPLHEYEICRQNATDGSKEIGKIIEQSLYEEILSPTKDASATNYENFKPRWAIDRSSVTLLNKVREGRFGYWFEGTAVVNSQLDKITVTVIIKNTDNGDNTDLWKQFNAWKILDHHSNFVTLLGCCIEEDPLYIIGEYVSNGDLHSYLEKSGNNHEYGNMLAGSNVLTPRDLMVFGVQVAAGMEYLSSLKIVHGDLATRNVLLDENRTCKICDFGPSTLSSQEATRWMAPESLLDNTFTTNSDVWSYGVLLWEITTLAATPYPGMSCQQVQDFVQDGGKLSKPKQCDMKLYDIMMCCWVSTPELRYGFSSLRKAVLDMLDNETDYIVVQNC